MRLGGLFDIFSTLFHSKDKFVIFQPSICGYSFIRDLLILGILRMAGCNIAIVVLSHIFYRNIAFKINWIREFFFYKRCVIGAANIKEVRDIAHTYEVITPLCNLSFDKIRKPEINKVKNILFCHIGYFDPIKGFDRFVALARNNKDQRFFAIGQPLKGNLLSNKDSNIEFVIPTSDSDFLNKVSGLITREDCLPVLLFMSKYDLAPILILELGASRMPICVEKQSNSYLILENFLPRSAFYAFDNISEIFMAEKTGQLADCANFLEKFVQKHGDIRFKEQVNGFIEGWLNDHV